MKWSFDDEYIKMRYDKFAILTYNIINNIKHALNDTWMF